MTIFSEKRNSHRKKSICVSSQAANAYVLQQKQFSNPMVCVKMGKFSSHCGSDCAQKYGFQFEKFFRNKIYCRHLVSSRVAFIYENPNRHKNSRCTNFHIEMCSSNNRLLCVKIINEPQSKNSNCDTI